MLSFNNTEVAFADKNDKGLKKTHLVFKLISIGWLNAIGTTLLSWALRLNLPVKGLIRATVFDHFCGGENIIDCENRIQELAKFNVKTILDYSVEGKQDDQDFDLCLNSLIESVERSKKDQLVPYCVVKLTGLIPFALLEKVSQKIEVGSDEEKQYQKGLQRTKTLCKASYEANIPLLIDAEESWIQDAIDQIALDMMHEFNRQKAVIFNTAQMYRHDRLAYIKALNQRAEEENFFIGLKVVRGAYMEKERERAERLNYPSPIQANKAATDKDYNLALKYCIDNRKKIALCCGTHNEDSSMYLVELMNENSINPKDPNIYFSQLLGMSNHISFNLANANYNVAKYVPYGPVKEVMPYLVRRANENTSIAGQTGRELNLILQEINRRKAAKA